MAGEDRFSNIRVISHSDKFVFIFISQNTFASTRCYVWLRPCSSMGGETTMKLIDLALNNCIRKCETSVALDHPRSLISLPVRINNL